MRKLCALVGLHRSSWYYEAKPDKDGPRERLKELGKEHKRSEYNRLHWQLRREGYAVNHKRTERIYREETLMLREKKRRKMAFQSLDRLAWMHCNPKTITVDNGPEFIGQWREEYQTVRPHSALGGLTPDEFRIQESGIFQEPVVL